MAKTTIVQSTEEPEPLEIIADAVIKVADGLEAINRSRLSRRAVVLLLQDATKLGRRDIEAMLDAGPLLKDYYIKLADPLAESLQKAHVK